MKKLMLFTGMLVLLAALVCADFSDFVLLERMQMTDPPVEGEDMFAMAEIANLGDFDYLAREHDFKNVKVTFMIPELDVRRRTGPFDIDGGDSETAKTYLEMPSKLDEECYYVRVTVSEEGRKTRVKHREICVE